MPGDWSKKIQIFPRVPCTYTFVGSSKYISKVKKLLSSCPTVPPVDKPSKKIKLENVNVDSDESADFPDTDAVWLKFGGQFLTKLDEDLLVECGWLNDRHINFAQRLLRSQFPEVKVLEHKEESKKMRCGVQVII